MKFEKETITVCLLFCGRNFGEMLENRPKKKHPMKNESHEIVRFFSLFRPEPNEWTVRKWSEKESPNKSFVSCESRDAAEKWKRQESDDWNAQFSFVFTPRISIRLFCVSAAFLIFGSFFLDTIFFLDFHVLLVVLRFSHGYCCVCVCGLVSCLS